MDSLKTVDIMLVKLDRPLKPKPAPQPKPLKSYVSKSCCASVDTGRLSDELTDLLKESPKPLVHIAKRKVRRSR